MQGALLALGGVLFKAGLDLVVLPVKRRLDRRDRFEKRSEAAAESLLKLWAKIDAELERAWRLSRTSEDNHDELWKPTLSEIGTEMAHLQNPELRQEMDHLYWAVRNHDSLGYYSNRDPYSLRSILTHRARSVLGAAIRGEAFPKETDSYLEVKKAYKEWEDDMKAEMEMETERRKSQSGSS